MVMTMVENLRTIPAGEFKAKCLQLLDEVAERGGTLIVTKRGRPVARVVPCEDVTPPDLRGSLLAEDDDAFAPQPELWRSVR